MNGLYLKSSPWFFRLIKRALLFGVTALLLLAVLFPAPLQQPADLAKVPNPVKSAWFLLWTQELVSYSKNFVYLIIVLGIYFLLLPYLPGNPPCHQARWRQKDQWLSTLMTLAAFFGIIALTVIAMFFRGENWGFTLNF